MSQVRGESISNSDKSASNHPKNESNLTMDTDSSCFVPVTQKRSTTVKEPTSLMSTAKSVEQNDNSHIISKEETKKKGLTACAKTEVQNEQDDKKDDSFHIGSLKWAKYKKKEKSQKS